MPKLVDLNRTTLDRRCTLLRRKGSLIWQVRFKLSGRWIRQSTKTTDLAEAKKIADDIFINFKVRLANNLPVVNKSFKSVAELTISHLQKQLDEGMGKSVFRDYIFAINKYFIPYFGKKQIHSISYRELKDFEIWRSKLMGRNPKKSTIGTHNSAFNCIVNEAIQQGYISSSNRIEFLNKGEKGKRRPNFSLEEYRKLHRYMRSWKDRARDEKSKQMRYLLRDYVLILANTGMRHGTETEKLKWKDLSIEKINGSSHLLVYVHGKTEPRELVARSSCITYFKRIHKRTEAIKNIPFSELLEKKLDIRIFTLNDGTKTKNLRQTFRSLLKEANLLMGKNEKHRTLYSLRHTYATFYLINKKGGDIHLLATQMGTSVSMIEKHYSHLIARMRAGDLAGHHYDVFVDIDD